MSEYQKATILPRLLVLVGAVIIALKVFLDVEILDDPLQTTIGGVIALVGVVWFLIALRKSRKG